jgi:phospholipid/cholesterol/gamma-HCH transport system substrate-binding protein
MTRFRYGNELVGAFVIAALLAFFGAALQAGVLRNWLNPGVSLRVLLPPEGSFGLSAGAQVEILGTRAGEVRRIVIEPNESLYADVKIDDGMKRFVRRDSKAFIRKQFGVAGASYLEISRGTAQPMDWAYAVIDVQVERSATETITALIEEARNLVIPAVQDAQKTIRALAQVVEGLQDPQGPLQKTLTDVNAITARLQKGEGAVGKLLTDDALLRELQTTVDTANKGLTDLRSVLATVEKQSLGKVNNVLGELEKVSRDVSVLSRALAEQGKAIPEIVAKTNAILGSLQTVIADTAKTTPELPSIARNVEATTGSLPALLIQTQETALELERLLAQLRGHWLLGGAASPPDPPPRLSPLEVRP